MRVGSYDNNTDTKITIRKDIKIGFVECPNENETIHPKKNEMFQINNINLTEVHKLRKEDLNESDFDLFYLDDTHINKLH